MRIGIIGTGTVAQAVAAGWAAKGHQITFGSRDPGARTLDFPVADLETTVSTADVVVNATPGSQSLAALTSIDSTLFAGKVVIDLANAATPAFELLYPNSSLGEKLQAALPRARLVKTMNTAAITVITDPSSVEPSNVFLSGNDADAKSTAAGLLSDFGWSADSIIDLGDISTSRGVEHYFLLFVAVMQVKKAPFNLRVA
jgi:predicted dinucleotide-binding enzyme